MPRVYNYDASVGIPVYVGWRCDNCETVNYSDGKIQYRVHKSSATQTGIEKEKEDVNNTIQDEAVLNAIQMMFDPRNNLPKLNSVYDFDSINCSNCGARAKWMRNTVYPGILLLSAVGLLICFFVAVGSNHKSIGPLLFAIPFILGIIYSIYAVQKLKKTMKSLPVKYMPFMGTEDPFVIATARTWFGKKIFTKDDIVNVMEKLGSETNK